MKLPLPLGAIAGDLFPVVTGIPLGSTLVSSVHRLIDTRRRQARDILIEELSQGRAFIESILEVDELAAIFLKYVRAAEEGTARLNLRLMAMAIRGMTHKRTLTANRFLYYAGFLATLSREEVIALATLYENEALEPDRVSDMSLAAEHACAQGKSLFPPFFLQSGISTVPSRQPLERASSLGPLDGARWCTKPLP
jgi:hypothetical protein